MEKCPSITLTVADDGNSILKLLATLFSRKFELWYSVIKKFSQRWPKSYVTFWPIFINISLRKFCGSFLGNFWKKLEKPFFIIWPHCWGSFFAISLFLESPIILMTFCLNGLSPNDLYKKNDWKFSRLFGRLNWSNNSAKALWALWPDLTKFRHFGKMSKVFCKFLRFYLLFCKVLNRLWLKFYDNNKIFFVETGKILKIIQPAAHTAC